MITVLSLTTGAFACGGFFCDTAQPVDQSGEAIVFGVQDGEVTTHVRISYIGPGTNFAWILPVPGVPDVFLSTEALFTALAVETTTTTQLQITTEPGCGNGDADTDADSDSDTDTDSDTYNNAGYVDVLAEAPVGPYETVVLAATDPIALVDWLQDNGFGVPDSMTGAIGPYLSNGMNFLALKLEKDADVGDLAPLGIRWPGDRPSIPLTLTSVAATPNMPLTVYVLGDERAVPLSYLHVQLNPVAFDWFGRGQSASARLGVAADEAGGRAFTTRYAQRFHDVALPSTGMSLTGLAEAADPLTWFLLLSARGFLGTPELLDILRTHVPAPAGVDENAFYNQPEYYPEEWAALAATFDAVAATAELDERLIQPGVEAQALLTGGVYLTRLDTVVSPEEMTVDPTFGFNPDLPPVPANQVAQLHQACPNGDTVVERITFPGGYDVYPPDQDFSEVGAWLDLQLDHVSLFVEQLSESGPGTVIADYSGELEALGVPPLVDPPSSEIGNEPTGPGCGCATGSPTGTLWIGAAALWRLRRRRSPTGGRGAMW